MVVDFALVGIGSALGGIARYAVSGRIARSIGETFPWGTMIVNISGSLVIGVLAALTGPSGPLDGNAEARALGMTGLCGGYTTFSSFSLQTLNLVRDGDWRNAVGNIVGSTALCLAAVCLGYAAAATLIGG